MKNLPKARTENLVVQELADEVLIYDLTNNKAYCLNSTAAKIYNACDGKTSFETVRSNYRFDENMIFLSLDELKKENLILTDETYQSPLQGLSRREAVRKVGLASLTALPIISAIVAPQAANAASGLLAPGARTTYACAPPFPSIACGGCGSCNCNLPEVNSQCQSRSAFSSCLDVPPGPPGTMFCRCYCA